MEVEYLVKDPLFLESGQYPVECHPVHGIPEQLFQLRLGDCGFLVGNNLQYAEPGLRDLEFMLAQQEGKSFASCPGLWVFFRCCRHQESV